MFISREKLKIHIDRLTWKKFQQNKEKMADTTENSHFYHGLETRMKKVASR